MTFDKNTNLIVVVESVEDHEDGSAWIKGKLSAGSSI